MFAKFTINDRVAPQADTIESGIAFSRTGKEGGHRLGFPVQKSGAEVGLGSDLEARSPSRAGSLSALGGHSPASTIASPARYIRARLIFIIPVERPFPIYLAVARSSICALNIL